MPNAIQGLNDVIASGWEVDEDRLVRDYVFGSFGEAIGFIAEMSHTIAAMNHHPEWTNVYATVSVELTTHDSGGITAKDVALAQAFDAAYARRLPPA
jgi:4a-hydroxytetrahydrobiopterin dehydratase